ncbi:hypothetical protein MC885_016135 [Smutsia gigantea]|nr:hypothetical protein MC885_016135 [Smutsia gigantea]
MVPRTFTVKPPSASKATGSRGDRDWNLPVWQPLLVMVGLEVGTGPALAKPSTTVTSTRTQAVAMAKSRLLPQLHGSAFSQAHWPTPADVCKVKRQEEIESPLVLKRHEWVGPFAEPGSFTRNAEKERETEIELQERALFLTSP